MVYLQTMKEKLTLNGKEYRQIMTTQKLHFVRTIEFFFQEHREIIQIYQKEKHPI